MAGNTRVRCRPVRLARLLIGPNKLRRPTDRLEGAMAMLLSAAFVAAFAAAPWFGGHLYQSQRAQAAQVHPVTAVLMQSGPPDSYMGTVGEVTARWRAPDGREQTGVLTTTIVPAIWDAPAGSRVQVWLTGTGRLHAPPVGVAEALASSVLMAGAAVCGGAIALLFCYWLCRLALDRKRVAAWASEWSQIGPRWTTRR